MSATGANKRRLTASTDADDLEPAWSPDGSVIAFAREFRTPQQSRVMTVQPDGSNLTGIGGRVVSVAAAPSYSPDGRWITTSETRGTGAGAVHAFSLAANAGPRVVRPVTLGGGRHARWMRRP
jgi:Tol biopolymer transport system component